LVAIVSSRVVLQLDDAGTHETFPAVAEGVIVIFGLAGPAGADEGALATQHSAASHAPVQSVVERLFDVLVVSPEQSKAVAVVVDAVGFAQVGVGAGTCKNRGERAVKSTGDEVLTTKLTLLWM